METATQDLVVSMGQGGPKPLLTVTASLPSHPGREITTAEYGAQSWHRCIVRADSKFCGACRVTFQRKHGARYWRPHTQQGNRDLRLCDRCAGEAA